MVEMYFVLFNSDIYGDIECILGNWFFCYSDRCSEFVVMIKIVGSGFIYICNGGLIICIGIVIVLDVFLVWLKIDYIDVY